LDNPQQSYTVQRLDGGRSIHIGLRYSPNPVRKFRVSLIETSEGHKVGLVKNLSLMGNVTIMMLSQISILKTILKDRIINVQDVPIDKLDKYTRVFLNGEWLGLTDDPKKLYNELKEMKYSGKVDIHTSVVYEIKSEVESKEFKVYCDGGRMFRPVFRVKDNKLLLNRDQINTISLDSKSATTISNWNEFLVRYPGVVEFIDVDEQFNAMIAMYEKDVNVMHNRMMTSAEKIAKLKLSKNDIIINRYDDFTYVKYTVRFIRLCTWVLLSVIFHFVIIIRVQEISISILRLDRLWVCTYLIIETG
jgi:DNA-directed RNA polymerase beta subunit